MGLKDVLGNSDGAQNIIDAIEAAAPLYGIGTTAFFLDYGYNASVSLTQPVYAGGRIVNGNKLALLNLRASVLKQAAASKNKGVEVDEKYWKVVLLEEKLISLNQALMTVDTLRRDVNSACSAGLAPGRSRCGIWLWQSNRRPWKMERSRICYGEDSSD